MVAQEACVFTLEVEIQWMHLSKQGLRVEDYEKGWFGDDSSEYVQSLQ